MSTEFKCYNIEVALYNVHTCVYLSIPSFAIPYIHIGHMYFNGFYCLQATVYHI